MLEVERRREMAKKLSEAQASALLLLASWVEEPPTFYYYRQVDHRRTERLRRCLKEAGAVPDYHHPQRCWTRTSQALVRRGLLQWVDTPLRRGEHPIPGLALTEAGWAEVEKLRK
jgi:hypothetical protein